MAVDNNRFTDFGSGRLRVFISDCFYYDFEIGSKAICGGKEKGEGEEFKSCRRAGFAVVV